MLSDCREFQPHHDSYNPTPTPPSPPSAPFIASVSSNRVFLCHFLSCTIHHWASVLGRWGRAALRITWRRASRRCTTTWGASISPPLQKEYTCWSKTQNAYTCTWWVLVRKINTADELHCNSTPGSNNPVTFTSLICGCLYSVHLIYTLTVHNNNVYRQQEQTWPM